MIRALHMIGALNRGGSEVLTLDVCRNAREAGLDISFVAGSGGDMFAEFAELDGFHYFERRSRLGFTHMWQIRKLVKSRGIQIVHAQQPPDAVYLYLATIGLKVKRVLSLQNFLLDARNRRAAQKMISRMDAVLPVSSGMLEWFRTEEGFEITDKFHVLHNGVDMKRLGPTRTADMQTLRQELGLRDGQPLIGMVGNFYPDHRKDQFTVCKALKLVFERFPDAHFVFAGRLYTGAESYYENCIKFCEENGFADRVHFLGQRKDIPDILRELDLFVFSTLKEGLPVAAVEVLMLGVPMIASDIPPVLEAVGADTPEGPCAEIFRTSDADDLADKVNALLAAPEKLKMLGEKARIQTPKRFGIDRHLQTLKRIYADLLAGT